MYSLFFPQDERSELVFVAGGSTARQQLIQQETSGVVSDISSGVCNYSALFTPHLFVQWERQPVSK
jgi:hypothetical protein